MRAGGLVYVPVLLLTILTAVYLVEARTPSEHIDGTLRFLAFAKAAQRGKRKALLLLNQTQRFP